MYLNVGPAHDRLDIDHIRLRPLDIAGHKEADLIVSLVPFGPPTFSDFLIGPRPVVTSINLSITAHRVWRSAYAIRTSTHNLLRHSTYPHPQTHEASHGCSR